MWFIEGVADAIIRKMTGHRSEELERYKHFSPTFKQQPAELIGGKLTEELGTKQGSPMKSKKATLTSGPQRYLLSILAGHTGQSSQLFHVAPGRNAQFLPAVARYLT